MRIGMVFSTPLPPCEGIGFYVWNLTRQLKKQGHQVQLITRGSIRSTWRESLEDIPVWRVTFLPLYPFHVHIHNLFVQQLLHRIESQLDILHLHSPLVHLPQSRLPALVTVHSPMRANLATVPSDNWFGWLVKMQAPVSIKLETNLFSRANRLVATSTSVAHELRGYGVDPDLVNVLGNGVDQTVFFPKPELRQESPPYLLTVCRLTPVKGIEDLIACASIVLQKRSDIRFLIAGSGPLEKKIKGMIKRSGLSERIILLGHIAERARLADLYRKAAIYVHPARFEGMPTVVLEAMASARPIVATAVDGVKDVLIDGVNSVLVPPRNPSRMADSILTLLDKPEQALRLGVEALRMIERRNTWEVVSMNYIAEYQALLKDQ